MKRLYHYPVMLVLTIFSILSLILFEAAAFVQFVLFQPDIYAEAMRTGRIDDVIYDDLTEYFKGFSAPTGIPEEVFLAPLNKEELFDASYAMTVDSISYLTGNTSSKPTINYDFGKVTGYVDAYIEQYSAANHIPQDQSYFDLVNNTNATIEAQIGSQLDVTMLYSVSGKSYAESVRNFAGYVSKGLIASGILLVFLVMLMIVIDRRHPRDLPYWFGIMLVSSSLIILVPAMYLDKIGYFNGFFMRSENVYRTVTSICNVSLSRIINGETLILIFGIFLIILTIVIHMIYLNYLKKQQNQPMRHHHRER